jgi:hypothetical protein
MGIKRSSVLAFWLVAPLCGCGAVDGGVTYLPESLGSQRLPVQITRCFSPN